MTPAALIQSAIASGLISLKPRETRRARHNLGVHRSQFPPGPDGGRAYYREWRRAWRRSIGMRPHVRQVPVAREDYPRTVAGAKAYRRDYQMAWKVRVEIDGGRKAK